MSKELIKRYFIFTLAIFICGMAISVIAKSNLGITPISSTNYVLSYYSDMSLGLVTLIFNFILIIIQLAILMVNKKYKDMITVFMQIPYNFIFSIAIDMAYYLLNMIFQDKLDIFTQGSLLALGIFLLALGVALEVNANVAMVSGEAVVRMIAIKLKRHFGTIKIWFDSTLVIFAVILSLIFSGFSSIVGIGIGTLIAAIFLGQIVKIILKYLSFLNVFYTSHIKEQLQEQQLDSE